MNVGNRIRIARKRVGMTQDELGAAIGIGKSSISEWESGKRSPDVEKMREIASILNTTSAYLIGDINDLVPIQSETLKGVWYGPIVVRYENSPLHIRRSVCEALQLDYIEPPAAERNAQPAKMSDMVIPLDSSRRPMAETIMELLQRGLEQEGTETLAANADGLTDKARNKDILKALRLLQKKYGKG